MPDESTIDMQAIAGLRELSPDSGNEFIRELIEIYLQDTPERMRDLEAALSKGDLPAFTRAAHTIKGSSSNFGATKLTHLAHALELQGKAGNLTDAPAAYGTLKAEYNLVAGELTKIANGV